MKLTGTCTWKQLCALSVELSAYVPPAETGNEEEDRWVRIDPDVVMMVIPKNDEDRASFVDEDNPRKPGERVKSLEDRAVDGFMSYPLPHIYYREFYGPGHKSRQFTWITPTGVYSTQIRAYRTPGRENEDSWTLQYRSWKDLNPDVPMGNDARTLFLWMKATRQFVSLDLLTYYLHGDMTETNTVNYALTMCCDADIIADEVELRGLNDHTLTPRERSGSKDRTSERKQLRKMLPIWADKLWGQFADETADIRRVMVDCLMQHHPRRDDNRIENLRNTLEDHGFAFHPHEARALLILLEEDYKKHLSTLDQWANQPRVLEPA